MTRAPVADLAAGERTLGAATSHYLARVLRLRAGSEFVAFDPATGMEADAVLLRADADAVVVRLGAPRAGLAVSRAVAWIQGFAKADKCDAIVRDATELGATRILVATTRRSVVKLDDARSSARAARWTRIAEEAARQCGRSDAPVVEPPTTWADALARVDEASARFLLWERATAPLGPMLLDALARGDDLAFACGPEGGIDDDEAELAIARGWKATSLGPLLLRTETVAAAVLGAARIWSAAPF